MSDAICIGRARPDDGCGYSGGASGDTCPDCGGMVLGAAARWEAESITLRARIAELEARTESDNVRETVSGVLRAAGYQYGGDALENVCLGWQLAMARTDVAREDGGSDGE